MIVKIFEPQASFSAIGYNLNKVTAGKAELMKAIGFEGLSHLTDVRPMDYLHYLEARSTLNSRIKKPQFHAMISAPDASYGKKELTVLAQKWLKAMGYGDQPCLLVFHKDTDQAHIHLVTTRVDRDGRKIDSSFEHKRAITELNKLMKLDELHQAQLDAGKALTYACSTKAQISLLLEGLGYFVAVKDEGLLLSKFGKPLFVITTERLDKHLGGFVPDSKRAAQLKAIFRKYQAIYDPALKTELVNLSGGRQKETPRFHSDLSDFLRVTFGLELVFHASGDKPPYGYTIIDHARHRVFKGSEIIRLKDLIEPGLNITYQQQSDIGSTKAETIQKNFGRSFQPFIANDVDDQQIHGPRRRRQKKSRTNTR